MDDVSQYPLRCPPPSYIFDREPLTADQKKLVEDNYKLVGTALRVSRCYRSTKYASVDDLRSEAYGKLMDVARTWSEGGGAKFSTYAVFCIRRHLFQVVRSRKGKLGPAGTDWRDAMRVVNEFPDRALAVDEDGDAEEAAFIVDRLMGALSERESAYVRMMFWDGLTCRKIAALDGITYQRVQQIISRALDRMRKRYDSACC